MFGEIIGYVLAIAALVCIGVVLTSLLKGAGQAGAGLGSMVGSVLTGLGKGAGDAAKGVLTGGGRAARDTMKGLRGGRKKRGTPTGRTFSDPARANKPDDDSSIGLGTAALALGFEGMRRGANALFGGSGDAPRGRSNARPSGATRSQSRKQQSQSGRRTKSSSNAAKEEKSTWRRATDAAKKSGKGFGWFAGKVRGDDEGSNASNSQGAAGEASSGTWQPFVGHAFAVDEATLQQLHETLGDTAQFDVQHGDDGRMYAVFQPEQWQAASEVLNEAGWAVDGWSEPEYAEADVVVDPDEGIVTPVQPRGPGLPGGSNTPNPAAGGRAVYEKYGSQYMRDLGRRGAAARHGNGDRSVARRAVDSILDSIIDTVRGD